MLSKRRILHVLALVLLVGIVAPFVIQAVPAVVGADHSYVVLSGSMEPRISPGDIVIVRNVSPESIHEGDIVSFETQGATPPITHRVVNINHTDSGLAFKTKGDNNEDPDQEIRPASNVIGRVILVLPFIGHVVRFAHTPAGFVTLLGVPISLLVLNELWSVTRGVRTDQATTDNTSGSDEQRADDGDPETAEQESETDRDEETDPPVRTTDNGSLSVTYTDLQVSTVALVAFAAYSVWIALARLDGASVAIAVATTGSALLVLGLFVITWLNASAPSEETLTADGGTDGESNSSEDTPPAE